MKFILTISIMFLTHIIYAQESIKYVDSKIYQSGKFIQKDFYVVNGNFTFITPRKIDSVVSLKNRFIIPPFGDSHTHNLDREWQMASLPKKYFQEGTIYILNLTSKLDGVKKLRPYFEQASTIDVAFSHQGLTSTLGHPFMAYEPFEMGLGYKDWKKSEEKIKKSRLDENNSYIFIDYQKDIREKLPSYFSEKPDVVKIFLLHSERYDEYYTNDVLGDGGLSIKLAKKIIRKSHQKNLKVYAHIESANDFKQGIIAGVDNFTHMPGYGWDAKQETKENYYVTDDIINLAIRKEVGIIPTVGQALNYPSQDSLKKVTFVKDFLIRFKNKGGKILIGSDIFNETLSGEIQHFINLDIFSPQELLKILCQDTPKSIFPKRKIGEIKEGFEASFLVLKKNPLDDINAIKDIELTVKQGFLLE